MLYLCVYVVWAQGNLEFDDDDDDDDSVSVFKCVHLNKIMVKIPKFLKISFMSF